MTFERCNMRDGGDKMAESFNHDYSPDDKRMLKNCRRKVFPSLNNVFLNQL